MPVNQLVTVWSALGPRRRVIVAGAALTAFLAVLLLGRMATAPSMALLYAGLEPAAAGAVVQALDQRGVAYEVRGDAIFVDAARRDLLRMALAEQGLPETGAAGYELLDRLSGFGTTARMFDAAYWRAKEGELARTILAWPQVRAARVHIAMPARRGFDRQTAPTAAVTVRLAGGPLTRRQAQALRHLVAAAVPRLLPEQVSVIDADRGFVPAPDAGGTVAAQDRAEALRLGALRLLEARVGPGNAVVAVTVTPRREAETLVEKRFDPQGRVAISTDTQEVTGQSSETGTGAATVASNLPDGAAAGGGTNSSRRSETRERVNYEVSETTRRVERRPGAIARLGVAVLVNSVEETDATGRTVRRPRSAEELAALGELVKSAVGFDAERGDSFSIRSLDFQPPEMPGTEIASSLTGQLTAALPSLLRTGMLAIVALALGLLVLRPALTRTPAPALPSPEGANGAAAPAATTAVIEGGAGADGGSGLVATNPPALPAGEENGAQQLLEDPVEQLQQIVSERPEDAIAVLRDWIDSEEEQTA